MDANVVRTLNEGPMGPQGPVKINHCIMNKAAGYGPVVRLYNLPEDEDNPVDPGAGDDITGGDDDIDSGSGTDTVTGGEGTDTVTTGDGTDTVTGGEGFDTPGGGGYNEDNGEETIPDIDNESGEGGE